MKNILFLLLFPLLYIMASAQNAPLPDKYQTGLFKTNDGAMLVYTSSRKSFRMDFVSQNIEPSENPNSFAIDSISIISQITPAKGNMEYDSLTTEQQKTSINLYMNNEIIHKFDITPPVTEWLTINNKLFLFWYYNLNDDKSDIDKQMFLTTLCFDQILNLSTPLPKAGGDFNKNKSLLIKTAKSLKLINSGINLQALYEELNR